MPDDKKYGTGDKPEGEKPIRNPKVKVAAPPRKKTDERQRDVSKRVKRGVKERVERTLKENKGGGYKRQLDAAEKAVEDEATKIPGNVIKKVKVRIEGDVEGPDGRPRGVETDIEAEPNG